MSAAAAAPPSVSTDVRLLRVSVVIAGGARVGDVGDEQPRLAERGAQLGGREPELEPRVACGEMAPFFTGCPL